MKPTLYLLLLLSALCAQGQPPAADSGVIGEYHVAKGLNVTFDVYRENDRLMLQILGQGVTEMNRLSPLVYEPVHVRPKATITFLKDSTGRVSALRWVQAARTYSWIRVSGDPGGYAGTYKLTANAYRFLHLTEGSGQLLEHISAEPDKILEPLGKDRYQVKLAEGTDLLVFRRDRQGQIRELTTKGDDIVVFDKTSSEPPHRSNRIHGFTGADSLIGALTPWRTCYDVLFYALDISIDPETKSIRGSNMIRFRTVTDFDQLQVDLHDNFAVDHLLYHGQELSYTRKYNAVFVRFPAVVKAGSTDSFQVAYSGIPLEPNLLKLQGGIFWQSDRNKDWWIESVTQGAGANLFWPCKDHLTDRPDSMRISVTIPTGLEEISNGRLLQRTDLPDGRTRYVWDVGYPIATYNVVFNIGDYVHFTDVYANGQDTIPLNFYALRYNLDYAHWLFGDIRRMLALYEKDFGPYPFPRDGFNILESIWPMEHQGAIGMGYMNVPFNGRGHDSAGALRTMWHESSHQWWGNSVGCRDNADVWFHEGFAQYAEFLNGESLYGRDSALRELTSGHPDNHEPLIGVYNVNHFHLGDVWLKGALVLLTLQDLIDNDSLWFSILRGIQRQFRYQPVSSKAIEEYISRATGTDYSAFFDQYLRHAGIPSLILHFEPHGADLEVRYKWEADVPGFRMPIKVTTARDSLAFIYPTSEWQTLKLKGMTATDFRVDTTEFYANVKKE